jgi:hypothetical protein
MLDVWMSGTVRHDTMRDFHDTFRVSGAFARKAASTTFSGYRPKWPITYVFETSELQRHSDIPARLSSRCKWAADWGDPFLKDRRHCMTLKR